MNEMELNKLELMSIFKKLSYRNQLKVIGKAEDLLADQEEQNRKNIQNGVICYIHNQK